MEVEEIQAQACKFPRVGNGRNGSKKIGSKGGGDHFTEDEEEELRSNSNGGGDGCENPLRGWHHSSRIIRVSRASGGKDRHSKVLTSRGLRDRRVRLSVTTAIQFYDLQDRLGVDQPSKAVEWLIKAASDAIAELPSLNNSFPDAPKQPSNEKRGNEEGFDSAEVELDGEPNFNHQNSNQLLSLSKSACSSTSETSKGSGLSLSQSEIRVNRVKARERARERAAKEKEKEYVSSRIAHHSQNVNPISENGSFTELLTGGIGTNFPATTPSTTTPASEANLFHKKVAAASGRQWPSTPMDYFSSGLLGPSSSSRTNQSSGFSGQILLGNSLPQTVSVPVPFNVAASDNNHNHSELQHFPFNDHFIPVVCSQPPPSGSDYNLNFTMSSGLAGFNRGTLQSNSPSFLPHFQRFSPIDGSSNLPFFIGATGSAAAPPMENHHHHHHQFSPIIDGRLQLCYGEGSRQSDLKGKGKN